MTRPLHSAQTPAALTAMTRFHSDVVEEVKKAVANDNVVIVGMGWNPVVKKARRILDEKKISYTYLEYGNYLTAWRKRLAIKLWSGWPTFPQVFVKGTLVGGCTDLEAALADGSFQKLHG